MMQQEERHGDPASIDLYKYPSPPATPPTSRKNVSCVKMTNVKMSNALCRRVSYAHVFSLSLHKQSQAILVDTKIDQS